MFGAAFVLLFPFVATPFVTFQIGAQSLALGLIALSLTFLGGYGGMVSLAQMTVAGIAGYVMAILGTSGTALSLGWPWWVVLPFALAIPVASAVLIGWLSARTEGIYTIMITLAMGVAFYYLALQNYDIFNGFQGFQRVAPPTVFGVDWRAPLPFYFLVLFWALAGYFLVKHVIRTPFGIALQGIRDNPRRMNALGYSVVTHRVAAHALAGVIAAIGGVLMVWYNGLITPGSVSTSWLINILVIAVLGGMKHPIGPFLGAIAFVLLQTFAIDLIDRERFNLADRRGVPRHRAVFPRRPAGLVVARQGAARVRRGFLTDAFDASRYQPKETTVRVTKRTVVRSLIGAAIAGAFAGGAWAQQGPVKIGLLATLEGPFAAGGADGMRGAELALKQRGGSAGGRKVEIVKASSDAKPDVAVNATRKLVEQDKVDIMVGPLSGSEGIAVKDYAKTQPNTTFINGSSGAQATTLVDPAPNFYRFNTEGAQWMMGLGKAAMDKGYKRVMVIAEDYSFPYSQVQGFMTEFCRLGGKVPTKAWVPLGGKDYSSVIAKIPKDVDALLVVLGGADAVNFLTQYESAGGDKPMLGGSITVSQDVLNYKGKRRDSLVGTMSAGPVADAYDGADWKTFVADYQKSYPVSAGGFPSPSLFAYVYYHEHEGGARRAGSGEGRPVGRAGEVSRGAREDDAEDTDWRRQARREPAGHRQHLRHRGREGREGQPLQQGRAQGRQRRPDARHEEGGLQDRLARCPGLPMS